MKRTIVRRLCCITTAVLVGGMLIHSASTERYQITHYAMYEVKCGDTLWSIADDTYNDSVDIRDMIDLIKDVNGIEEYKIYPGMCLSLPMSDQITN